MPFQIVRNDITKMQVDAIVTSTNPEPVIEAGVDSAIHKAAGPQLLEARKKMGTMLPGSTGWTEAYDLPAKIVIHTSGPVWQGGSHGEEALLKMCYEESLGYAVRKGCKSIAFPMISTGTYGFPKDRALEIAISVFTRFLAQVEMDVYLVVFDKDSYRISEKLFSGVKSYIDENYVNLNAICRSSLGEPKPKPRRQKTEGYGEIREMRAPMAAPMAPPCPRPAPEAMSLADMLKNRDAGFSETLLRLIDQRGHKDSAVYKRANMSKQHFSKIRNNPDYKPTKATALALAVALELNMDETRDFIGRAGFALSRSSKFDLIVRYFIENRNYNIVEINMALYEFDQPLLGN